LKHAKATTNDPFYIAPTYAKIQLETIFQESNEEKRHENFCLKD
jgi:hypothetical protein